MPILTIDWLQGRSAQQKQALAKSLTQAFVDIAKVTPDQVWIVFRDVPRADWAMGGKLLGQETGDKALLKISVPRPVIR